MHEITHYFQNAIGIDEELHKIYLSDDEMDSIVRGLSKIIPDLKGYQNQKQKIDWFSYLYDPKNQAIYDDKSKLVYFKFLEAMPRILEYYII